MAQAQDENPTGDSSQPGDEPKVFVNENEWIKTQTELAELKGYKQAMEQVELRLGQQHPEVQAPQPQVQPKPPEFQYHSEEELQKALEDGDFKSYHRMTKHNTESKLAEEIWKLETTKIQPLQQTGLTAISELSGAVAKSGMTHLDVPEVKRAYESRLQQLQAAGQVVTQQLHKGVYDWAVGENIAKVEEKIQQGLLRQAQQEAVNTPSGQTGRKVQAEATVVPSVTEAFEPVAIQKLQQKYPGLSPEQAADREFQRHGGWAGYYKKFYAKEAKK